MKDEPTGLCYKNALICLNEEVDRRFESGADDSGIVLIHGSIIPKAGPNAGERIDHAWVVVDDRVLDRSVSSQNTVLKETYYVLLAAEERKRYLPNEAIMETIRAHHYGPWDTAPILA